MYLATSYFWIVSSFYFGKWLKFEEYNFLLYVVSILELVAYVESGCEHRGWFPVVFTQRRHEAHRFKFISTVQLLEVFLQKCHGRHSHITIMMLFHFDIPCEASLGSLCDLFAR